MSNKQERNFDIGEAVMYFALGAGSVLIGGWIMALSCGIGILLGKLFWWSRNG